MFVSQKNYYKICCQYGKEGDHCLSKLQGWQVGMGGVDSMKNEP